MNEYHVDQSPEIVVCDIRKYRTIAAQLEKDNEQLYRDMDESMNLSSRRNLYESIDGVLHQFSNEILSHYVGHGVMRGNALESAISILENHACFGFATSLTDSNYGAYTHAPFFILARRDTGISSGKQVLLNIDGKIVEAAKLNPDVIFVCNLAFDSLVDGLRKLYPDAKILRAPELVDYIKKQEGLV